MDIQDLGAIGEFISSVAIVITLIFLTMETRHARNATQQGNRQARHQIRTDISLSLAVNPQLSELLAKSAEHLGGDPFENELGLTGSEYIQLLLHTLSSFRHFEDQYFSDLPESDRLGLERQLRQSLSTSTHSKLWELLRSGFDDRFQQYVDNLIREGTQGDDQS